MAASPAAGPEPHRGARRDGRNVHRKATSTPRPSRSPARRPVTPLGLPVLRRSRSLVRAAIDRQLDERVGSLPHSGDRAGRARAIESSGSLLVGSGSTKRSPRRHAHRGSRAATDEIVREQVEVTRHALREQIEKHFAPELDRDPRLHARRTASPRSTRCASSRRSTTTASTADSPRPRPDRCSSTRCKILLTTLTTGSTHEKGRPVGWNHQARVRHTELGDDHALARAGSLRKTVRSGRSTS